MDAALAGDRLEAGAVMTLTQWSGVVILVLVAIGVWTQRRAISRWFDKAAESVR